MVWSSVTLGENRKRGRMRVMTLHAWQVSNKSTARRAGNARRMMRTRQGEALLALVQAAERHAEHAVAPQARSEAQAVAMLKLDAREPCPQVLGLG